MTSHLRITHKLKRTSVTIKELRRKIVWTWVVIVVNGIFVVLVLIEIFSILLLTCKEIQEVHLKTFHSTLFTLDHTPVFNRNSKGINNHRCNSNNHRSRPWKTISLQKENWQFRDLQSSFRPINPGKGTLLDSCLEFFVSLQNFPSNFTKKLMENNQQVYITQTQTYECHNQRATYKNFWITPWTL